MSDADAALRLGVLVPCRDEAAVVARKLADLAAQRWPACARPHRVVVVDDHSRDDTGARARGCAPALAAAGVELLVSASARRPGKNGALEHGLALLADVDLVVLTDADVLLGADALARLAEAFAADPRLGLACGEQVFVDDLDDLDAARPAAQGWDRWTARVRRLESRCGALFSVHGQLLAWRAELGLAPRAGVAADDVDLMLQARASARPRVGCWCAARASTS
ncbi:MAG: glycosyltransferase [Planctomycetes bacterium]|nr:glycosyltransferase [Planctomycetota bacterium]